LDIQRRSGGVKGHSVDEIARRSRGAAKAPGQEPAGWIKKNRQFLAKKAGGCYCFSERPISPAGASHRRRGTGTSALETGNDSEMAPQAVEIAKNGLGDPPFSADAVGFARV